MIIIGGGRGLGLMALVVEWLKLRLLVSCSSPAAI